MSGAAPGALSGAARVAGVVGFPVEHSLSPLIHNSWIAALGLDAVYVPFPVHEEGFVRLIEGFRGGAVRGVNVTLPFKETALGLSDIADEMATLSGAANILVFHKDGRIEGRNTDGLGLLYALKRQAPGWSAARGPVVILGAGGAARGAVAALQIEGATDIRILNRTVSRARTLAEEMGVSAFGFDHADQAFDGAYTLINATSGQLAGNASLPLPASAPGPGAVAMDMVYKPLITPFLDTLQSRGFSPVDGLDMLIGQARPGFEAFFGRPPPEAPDVRAAVLLRLKA